MVKIENDNSYKVGDKVWWFDLWDNLRWGTIYGFEKDFAKIYEHGRIGSATGAKICDCWPSEDECLKAEAYRADLQKAEYKKSIKDVDDLVTFLFKHDIHSSTRDYEALAAAKERAKELMGLEID